MITPANWERIRALFQTALERPPNEREKFLREQTEADDAIRREVVSLLAAHAEAPSFLEDSEIGSGRAHAADTASPLARGSRLGAFEILGSLGSGGMGEVYKARDTRLDRTVAIKVLASRFGADVDNRKRFEREAHTLAGLSHPHICTLYDVGQHDGLDYLVMEYLDGETLADRLKRSRLTLAQALRYSIEIADALDKAHRAGIVHRDLKPGNIMVTKSGAKLLDFGLARVLHPSRFSVDQAGLASRPVVTRAPNSLGSLTGEGMILGTLQYMAPEQLEGKEADARTDLFALGTVIYEMVAGQRPFQGSTDVSLIAAILEHEPPPIGPAPLEGLVRRCLVKDPQARWQNAWDLKIALEWVATGDVSSNKPARRSLVPWLALAATCVAGLVVAVLNPRWLPTNSAAATLVRLSLPVATTAQPGWLFHALSADGTQIAYSVSFTSNQSYLFVRRLSSFETLPIHVSGTWITNPAFSPNGDWIGFSKGVQLMKIPATGGVPQTICRTSGVPLGIDWTSDDTIVLGMVNEGLLKVRASGGALSALTTVNKANGELGHLYPQLLPGGDAVLFTVQGPGPNDYHIAVESLSTHQRRALTSTGTHGWFATSGHLVYAVGGELRARAFDLASLRVTGPETSVVTLPTEQAQGGIQFALAANGTLSYASGAALGSRTLVWVDRQGRDNPLPVPSRVYRAPRLSPDGRRVAVQIEDGNLADVWTYDLAREALAQLTHDGRSRFPEWHPDGQRLVFTARMADPPVGGPLNLFLQAADGSGVAERLLSSERSQWMGSFSPDGDLVAVMERAGPTTLGDILVLPLRERSQTRPFLHGPATEWGGRISPDGRWLAYVSDESGRFEVYVTPFPAGGRRWQISTDGGTEVVWARNGHELFWRQDNTMMIAGIEGSTNMVATRPKALFKGFLTGAPGIPDYDITVDGQTFLMVKGTKVDSTPSELNIVLNWLDELRTKVGSDLKR